MSLNTLYDPLRTEYLQDSSIQTAQQEMRSLLGSGTSDLIYVDKDHYLATHVRTEQDLEDELNRPSTVCTRIR